MLRAMAGDRKRPRTVLFVEVDQKMLDFLDMRATKESRERPRTNRSDIVRAMILRAMAEARA